MKCGAERVVQMKILMRPRIFILFTSNIHVSIYQNTQTSLSLDSDVQLKGFAGFGIGLELPAVGTTIFEGVTFAGCLFFPVFNLNNDFRIGIGASVYAFYNF